MNHESRRGLSRRAMLKYSACGSLSFVARALPATPASASHSQPIVPTKAGRVRGRVTDRVNIFKGIPYGASTAGERRFQPPSSPVAWTGVRDALQFGPMAMQRPVTDKRYLEALSGLYPLLPYPMSEECLHLNVWSPELGKTSKRPVMVWLHPGGFGIGAGNSNWSDGANLARKNDVVVVSLNHRLDIFGYLYLADIGGRKYAESGNAGILDIVAALHWVQDNIAEFGGDPGNVTIFGESGGGAKVCVLMAMPSAKGLFHKAAIQSTVLHRAATREEAAKSTRDVMDRLQLGPSDLDKLLRLSPDKLLDAVSETWFHPVVAGTALPRHPFDPDAPEISAQVPVLLGTTKDEANYNALSDPPTDLTTEEATRQALVKSLSWDGVVDSARAGDYIQSYREFHPGATLEDTFFGIANGLWLDDAALLAERKIAQDKAPIYMYLFAWESAALGGSYKSGHTVEIPFVFDNVDAAPQFYGPTPDPRRYELASKTSTAWAAFAHTGNPSHARLPLWKPYTRTGRETMVLNDSCELVKDPQREERLGFERLRPLRLPRVHSVGQN